MRVRHDLVGRVLARRCDGRHARASGNHRVRNAIERSRRIVRRAGDAVDAGVCDRERHGVRADRTERLRRAGLIVHREIDEADARADAFRDLPLEIRCRLRRPGLLDVRVDGDRVRETPRVTRAVREVEKGPCLREHDLQSRRSAARDLRRFRT